MDNNNKNNLGAKISEAVRSAIQSGDLSKLQNLGSDISDAAQNLGAEINSSVQNSISGNKPQGSAPPVNSPIRPPAPSPPKKSIYSPPAPVAQNRSARNAPAWMGSSTRQLGPSRSAGVGAIVLSSIGLAVSSIGVLATFAGAASVFSIVTTGFWGVLSLSFIYGITRGNKRYRLANRVRQYYMFLEQGNNVQTFEALAVKTGESETKTRKNIKDAIKFKMMPFIKTDKNETCLILGEEAYNLYTNAQSSAEMRAAERAEIEERLADPETSNIEKFRQEGLETIQKIKTANKDIPGEKVSDQLLKLEVTTSKIFTYVQKHPDKLPDTRRFLSYYLPTTLKLVEKYRQYEKMDIHLETVQTSKREIENAFDKINIAFVNLLNDLYKEDTLDISTDIEVLQTVLAQEGLTDSQFDLGNEPKLTL